GGEFCGLTCKPAKVLVVSEEAETLWAARRDTLGIGDHVSFLLRPFRGRPDYSQWTEFLDHVGQCLEKEKVDLLIFDPLAALWPVVDENDAAGVQSALAPLHSLADGRGILLVHHPKKGDGQEATASRGSGALPAFADIVLEMRRFKADEP